MNPVSPSAITSGTDPRGWAITGVPHAMDSVITSPKGSSQSIGNSTPLDRDIRSAFSCTEISPSTTVPSGRIGSTSRFQCSSSSGSAIFTARTRGTPAFAAAWTARWAPLSTLARPTKSTKSSLSAPSRNGYIEVSIPL